MTTDYDPAGRYFSAYRRTWDRTRQDHLREETAARVAYGQLPWWERLVTPPPPGWPGGHAARLLAWGRQHTTRKRQPT